MPPVLTSQLLSGSGAFAPGTGKRFIPHSERWVKWEVTIDMLALPLLPDRLAAVYHEALVVRLGEAAHAVVELAKSKLKMKPAGVITPDGNIYGLDTGKMHDTLTATLVSAAEGMDEVAYDLESPEADYWIWVEFGHMLRSGVWWPGYRFLSTSVEESSAAIVAAIRQSWYDTIIAMGMEARI